MMPIVELECRETATLSGGESQRVTMVTGTYTVSGFRSPPVNCRFATPRDLAESIAGRLPNVGVFLSTNAESEVYE